MLKCARHIGWIDAVFKINVNPIEAIAGDQAINAVGKVCCALVSLTLMVPFCPPTEMITFFPCACRVAISLVNWAAV